MKTKIIVFVTLMVVFATIPINHAETPTLNDLLWGADHVQLSDSEHVLTAGSNQFDVYTNGVNMDSVNIGFQIRTENLPSYITVQVILRDNTGRIRLYSLYNKASKLIGSENYRNQIISYPSYYYETTGFNPAQTVSVTFKILSNGEDWTIWINDIRAYPEIKLYPNGAVIICADGAPYQGVSDMLLPKLNEYGYKMCLATSTVGLSPNWDLIEDMSQEGHDIGVYARMFELSPSTQLLPASEFQYNTYGVKDQIRQHTGKEPTFLQANRHLTDERTDTLLKDGFPIIKGSSLCASSSVALPFYDYYGGTRSNTADINGITDASTYGTIYVLFDHWYPEWHYAAKSQDEINTLVDHIHASGVEVITWTQLYNDLYHYFNQDTPTDQPTYSIHLVCNSTGYYVWINNVDETVRHFTTRTDVENYLSETMMAWEGIP